MRARALLLDGLDDRHRTAARAGQIPQCSVEKVEEAVLGSGRGGLGGHEVYTCIDPVPRLRLLDVALLQ